MAERHGPVGVPSVPTCASAALPPLALLMDLTLVNVDIMP